MFTAASFVKAVDLLSGPMPYTLCRIHPAGQTAAGAWVNRWAVILRDYRAIRDVVLDSPLTHG